jgi:hypothetical protein
MKKIWMRVAHSFKEANNFDREYYLSMSPSERLADMQFLRESYLKFKKGAKYGKGRTRLRRVITIIQ